MLLRQTLLLIPCYDSPKFKAITYLQPYLCYRLCFYMQFFVSEGVR